MMGANHDPRELPPALVLTGPTASGKSALAIEIARALGGVVVNADSMQVYKDLHVITARPTPAEQGDVPHLMFGGVDAAVNYSVGRWLTDARATLAELAAARRPAVRIERGHDWAHHVVSPPHLPIEALVVAHKSDSEALVLCLLVQAHLPDRLAGRPRKRGLLLRRRIGLRRAARREQSKHTSRLRRRPLTEFFFDRALDTHDMRFGGLDDRSEWLLR
jgi:hypothetical protein